MRLRAVQSRKDEVEKQIGTTTMQLGHRVYQLWKNRGGHDDKTLEDRFTIDDPKAYSKPWTAVRNFYFQPTLRFLEYVCEDNREYVDANGGTHLRLPGSK